MSYIQSLIEISNLLYKKDLELDHYVQKYLKLELKHDSLMSKLNLIKEIAEQDTKANTQARSINRVDSVTNGIRPQKNKLKVATKNIKFEAKEFKFRYLGRDHKFESDIPDPTIADLMLHIQRKFSIPLDCQRLYLSHVNSNIRGFRLDNKTIRKISTISHKKGETVIVEQLKDRFHKKLNWY